MIPKLAFTTCTDAGFILGAMGTVSSIRKFYTADEADVIVFLKDPDKSFEAFCSDHHAEVHFFKDIQTWVGKHTYERPEYASDTSHFYHPDFSPIAGAACTDTKPSDAAPFGTLHHLHPLNVKAYCTGFCINERQYERVVHIDADAFILSRIEAAWDGVDGEDVVISGDDGSDGLVHADAMFRFKRPVGYRGNECSFNAGIVLYSNGPIVQRMMRDFMFYIDSCYHYTNFGNDQGLLRALVLKYRTTAALRLKILNAVNWNPTWQRADDLVFDDAQQCWINRANNSRQFMWHGAGCEKLWTGKYLPKSVNAAWQWIGGRYITTPSASEAINLKIIDAWYGVDESHVPAADYLRSLIRDDRLVVPNDGRETEILGEPAPGVTKSFLVTYSIRGVEKTERFPKHIRIDLGRRPTQIGWQEVHGSLRGHTLTTVADLVAKHFASRTDKVLSILDMGTQHGRTAVGFCELLRNAGFEPKLTTIDIYSVSRDYPESFAREHNTHETISLSTVADCITALKVDPLDDYRSMLPTAKFDFIYVDADHTFKHVIADCVLARSMLNDGGIIIGDDYNLDSVRAATALVFGAVTDLGGDQWMITPPGR